MPAAVMPMSRGALPSKDRESVSILQPVALCTVAADVLPTWPQKVRKGISEPRVITCL